MSYNPMFNTESSDEREYRRLKTEIEDITNRISKIKASGTAKQKIKRINQQIESVRKNIAWQNNRCRQANTIIKRGY
jgi:peptidoglycan hydrolase CwlO-like protein